MGWCLWGWFFCGCFSFFAHASCVVPVGALLFGVEWWWGCELAVSGAGVEVVLWLAGWAGFGFGGCPLALACLGVGCSCFAVAGFAVVFVSHFCGVELFDPFVEVVDEVAVVVWGGWWEVLVGACDLDLGLGFEAFDVLFELFDEVLVVLDAYLGVVCWFVVVGVFEGCDALFELLELCLVWVALALFEAVF